MYFYDRSYQIQYEFSKIITNFKNGGKSLLELYHIFKIQMKEGIKNYDMCCFEDQCISTKKYLFNYSTQKNDHKGHKYDIIHPSRYQQKYQLIKKVEEERKIKLLQSINNQSKQIGLKISECIYQIIYPKCLELISKNFRELDSQSCQSFLQTLIQGNSKDQMIKVLSFLYFHQENIINRDFEDKFTKIQSEINTLSLEMANGIMMRASEFIKIQVKDTDKFEQSPYQRKKSHQLQNTQKKEIMMREIEDQSIQVENSAQKHSKMNYQPSSNADDPSIHLDIEDDLSNQSKVLKVKKIDRRRKQYQKLKKNIVKSESFKLRKGNRSDLLLVIQNNNKKQFIQSQPQQIVQNNFNQQLAKCKAPQQYYSLIIRNQQQVQYIIDKQDKQVLSKKINKVVFFYDNIGFDQFRSVISRLPQLKVIMLNCYHLVTAKAIDMIAQKTLNNLVRFNQFWDENTYFHELQLWEYFPESEFSCKKPKKIHIRSKTWKQLINLKSIWISSNQDVCSMEQSNNKFEEIDYLKVEPCNCCLNENTMNNSKLLSGLQIHSISLKTIVIKNINLDFISTKNLLKILMLNKEIQCMQFQDSGVLGMDIIETISKYKLTKFSLKFSNNYPLKIVRIQPILNIRTLQYLSVNNIKLESFQFLKYLDSLVFLNLYQCHISQPSNLAYSLHPNVLNKGLLHLNLGDTNISKAIIKELPRITNLAELNLDKTNINLHHLTEAYNSKNGYIKKLSISNLKEFENVNINKLCSSFPSLQYFNISRNKFELKPLTFVDFIYLKCLCVDKQLLSHEIILQFYRRKIILNAI